MYETNAEAPRAPKADRIYVAYDRYVGVPCCAGYFANSTGMTFDGHTLMPLTASEVRYWVQQMGTPLRCECGRLRARIEPEGCVRFECFQG